MKKWQKIDDFMKKNVENSFCYDKKQWVEQKSGGWGLKNDPFWYKNIVFHAGMISILK